MTDAVLQASGLTYTYGDRRVVDGLNLTVTRGRAYGLLGPNGAGKTTTVRLVGGLLTPDAGSVALFGEPLSPQSAPRLRQRIGVQTDTELYATLSARENLMAWGGLFGMPPKTLPSRVDEVLEMMNLSSRAGSLVGSFSKGMRQKLAVGRALLARPELLFLDEPTAGLDPEATEELISDLTSLMREGNLTVVIATHQLHGLEQLCSDVGIIVGGRLVAQGAIDALIGERWPATEVTIETDPAAASVLRGALPTSTGVTLPTQRPEDIPAAVATLVGTGFPVRAVIPRTRTVQDLYFATVTDAGKDAR